VSANAPKIAPKASAGKTRRDKMNTSTTPQTPPQKHWEAMAGTPRGFVGAMLKGAAALPKTATTAGISLPT